MSSAPPALIYARNCDRCKQTIPKMHVHLRLTVEMLTGSRVVQHYCNDCCKDPSMAILFADVMLNPVKRMEVSVVFR